MKRTIALLFICLVFLQSCAMLSTYKQSDVSETEAADVVINKFEEISVNGYKGMQSIQYAGPFTSSNFDKPCVGLSVPESDFNKYNVYFSTFSRFCLSFQNEEASERKEIEIDGKKYTLLYSQSLINRYYIVDEYSVVDDETLKFRFFINSNQLAHVTTYEITEEREGIDKSIDYLFGTEFKIGSEDELIDYSKTVAKSFGFDLNGLKPVCITVFKEKSGSDNARVEGYLTEDNTTENREIESREVSWRKYYGNGLYVECFNIQTSEIYENDFIASVRFSPAMPEEMFVVPEYYLDQTIPELYDGNVRDDYDYSNFKVSEMYYEIVCNNIPSLVVIVEGITDIKSGEEKTSMIRFFPGEAEFPEIPDDAVSQYVPTIEY